MIRLVLTILAVAVLASMAATTPRDPVYIIPIYDTPMGWACEFVADEDVALVISPVPKFSDPLWWELVELAKLNQVPASGSELANCFSLCQSTCAVSPNCGIKRVKYVGGEKPSCECECHPCNPTTNPPPPSKEVD